MKGIYPIIGAKFRGARAEDMIRDLAKGEPLVLERDPGNKFDQNAVKVIARGEHVGFVPRGLAAKLAFDMDRAGETTRKANFTFGTDRAPCAQTEEIES